MKQLKDYALGFAHRSMLDKFAETMTKQMDTCKKIISNYNADNTDMKQCVLAMDREMCNKVNKIKHLELETRFEQFEAKISKQIPEIFSHSQKVEYLVQTDFDLLKKAIIQNEEKTNSQVQAIVRQFVDTSLAQYN